MSDFDAARKRLEAWPYQDDEYRHDLSLLLAEVDRLRSEVVAQSDVSRKNIGLAKALVETQQAAKKAEAELAAADERIKELRDANVEALEDSDKVITLTAELAAERNRFREHLAKHKTADAHDCARMEEMYAAERERAERLEKAHDALLNTLGASKHPWIQKVYKNAVAYREALRPAAPEQPDLPPRAQIVDLEQALKR